MDVNEKRLMAKRAYARNLVTQNQTPQPPSNAAVMGESLTRQVPSSILGFPGDMIGLARDTIDSGYHFLKDGPDAPYQQLPPFPGGSEWLKNNVFGEVADRDTYTDGQKLRADVVEFGVPALVGGAAMAGKAKNIKAGVDKAPSLLAPVFEQYMFRPKSQIAQDVASSIGAAGGKNLAEDQEMGPIGTLFTTLLGGAGGSFAAGGTESVIRNYAASRPVQMSNGIQSTGRTIDDARGILDNVITDKTSALQNIDDSLQMSGDLNISDSTLGPASGDVGLSMLDVQQRSKNPRPFAVKDQQVRTDVANNMNKFSNPDADVIAPQIKSQAIIDDEMLKQQTGVNSLYDHQNMTEQQLRNLQQQSEELVAPIIARRGEEGRASRLLNEQIGPETGALKNMTDMRKQAIEAVDPTGSKKVDTNELGTKILSLNDDLNKYRMDQTGLPADFMSRVDDMTKKITNRNTGILDESGNPLISSTESGGKVSLKDIQDMRKPLPDAISRAEKSGNFDLASKLKGLGESIDGFLRSQPDESVKNALAANDQYMQFFGKQQPTARAFRDLVQRNASIGTADPDNIAGMFLNSTKSAKEDLTLLREIVPDAGAFDNAEEMYFDAMLAKKELNPKTVRNFIADNQDILSPKLKTKYQNLVQEMMGNRQSQDDTMAKLNDMKRTIREAEGTMRQKEGALRAGPFGKMARADADKYVDSIMSSDDRLQQIDQVIEGFKGDQKAMDGFREAFVRRLQRKVRGTASAHTDVSEMGADGRPVLYSKLSKALDDDREVLSKMFTPEEMHDLTRIQRLMAKQGNLSRRATTGSDTTEKLSLNEDHALDLISQAINIKFGLIGGGMINRVTRGLANQFFTGKRRMAADELLTQIALNPKVAKEVLEATPLTVENGQLVNRINAAMAAQNAVNDDPDDPDDLTP